MNRSSNTVLLVTVGGSHVPVKRAVQDSGADFVCFVCSADDPATGQKGSYVQITGKGNFIKVDYSDKSPSLPNIPTQLGLDEMRYEILVIEADDFDDVYSKVAEYLEGKPPETNFIADYTGGTKTMSAALVMAALDHGGVKLQLVTGPRTNLRAVNVGESVTPAAVENSRFHRAFCSAVEPWTRFAYDDALERLSLIPVPVNAALRSKLQRARVISEAFVLWDRFQHCQAKETLGTFRAVLRKTIGPLLGDLDLLGKVGSPAHEILQIYDLWRNAQRCATQGRYDDAVARLYRLLEWSAQWLLKTQADIDSADIPPERIPEGMSLTANQEGKYQVGLYAAWELAACLCKPEVSGFWEKQKSVMLNHLKA